VKKLCVKSSYIYLNNDTTPIFGFPTASSYIHGLAWQEGTLNGKDKFVMIRNRVAAKNYI
jgi:hypothetical protein